MKKLREETGIVLVMILWVLVLLSTIAAQFALSTRAENQASMNHKESVQAYYIARAGMLQTIDRLTWIAAWEDFATSSDSEPEVCLTWNKFSRPCGLPGGDRYRVMLEDGATKINVNDDNGLHWLDLLLKSVDIGQETRSTIIESLLDWRDKDSAQRPHGAEEDYYRQLNNPYHCKNADLDTVEELLLVKGMNKSILYGGKRDGRMYPGVSRFLTVLPSATGTGTNKTEATITIRRLNVNTCPLDMLSILLHITPEGLKEIQTQREKQGYFSGADLAKALGSTADNGILPLVTCEFPDLIRITVLGLASGHHPGSAMSALVKFGITRRQFEVLEWHDVVDSSRHVTVTTSTEN